MKSLKRIFILTSMYCCVFSGNPLYSEEIISSPSEIELSNGPNMDLKEENIKEFSEDVSEALEAKDWIKVSVRCIDSEQNTFGEALEAEGSFNGLVFSVDTETFEFLTAACNKDMAGGKEENTFKAVVDTQEEKMVSVLPRLVSEVPKYTYTTQDIAFSSLGGVIGAFPGLIAGSILYCMFTGLPDMSGLEENRESVPLLLVSLFGGAGLGAYLGNKLGLYTSFGLTKGVHLASSGARNMSEKYKSWRKVDESNQDAEEDEQQGNSEPAAGLPENSDQEENKDTTE